VARVVRCECETGEQVRCRCSEVEDRNWQDVVVKQGAAEQSPWDVIGFWLREGERCCLECLAEEGNTVMDCIDFCGANCDELTEFEDGEDELL
jgi:hypothetical protein